MYVRKMADAEIKCLQNGNIYVIMIMYLLMNVIAEEDK